MDTLDGNMWGWTIDPAPTTGLHLRCLTLDGRRTVQLEGPAGERAWVPGPGFPTGYKQEILESRPLLEAVWGSDIIRQGRIRLEQDGSLVTVEVYPGEGDLTFSRVIDLRRDAGVLHPPTGDGEVALTAEPEAAIVVYADRPARWQVRLPLAGMVWRWP